MNRRLRDAAANAQKVAQLSEFRSLMQERRKIFLEYQQKRVAVGFVKPNTDKESREIVERVEELVSEKVEPAA